MISAKKEHKSYLRIIGIIICLFSFIFIAASTVNMQESLKQQANQQGEARLQKVSNDMQRTLENSKTSLLRFAADVEVYLALGADQDELYAYLKSQSNIFRDQSENTLMNAFIYTSEWVVISDSDAPDNYDATQRYWYQETVNSGIDNIYITAPYRDAFTGDMCFTSALLLSDGKTIVALDYNLSQIQDSIEQMNREDNGEALIINRDGLVVGCTDNHSIGKALAEVMPEYTDIYSQIITEKSDNIIINARIREKDCTVFCNRSGEWIFVYSVENGSLYRQLKGITLLNIVQRASMLIGILFIFIGSHSVWKRRPADEKSSASENLDTEQINASAGSMTSFTKSSRNGIMGIMILTVAVAVVFTGIVLVNWGNDRIEREIDSYNYQLERWMNTQVQTLNMFVDTIAANPSVLDDYDYAVEYLDRIVRNYPEISAAYIARPGNEHEMTMNNGWVPNADYIVAERQWYIDTENSENEISVSSPYLDARTGLYCVTFSRVVRDAVTNEQIGVFALDFYLGNLTGIMEESYSDDGYAFLVDNNDLIVNHPNDQYQISSNSSTNIAGTEYSDVKSSSALSFIKDYDGKLKVCVSRTESVTGFSVFAVKNITSIYGIVIMSGGTFIILLAVCIVLLYNLIVKMMKWQEKTRTALIEEAYRASQADHAKSSFLAQMSHEIRTPINAVLGMNEMILREAKDEKILNYASNAYNSGNALLSIINDILDISKIEAGRLEITETEYDLAALVSDCYHMTAERAEKKELCFTAACDKELPSRLKGDMVHIRQIVVNFLTNAIKYTDKGSVELSFSGSSSDTGFILQFTVKDTGIGIKPENVEKLFSSFQRFDLERNQTVEGTGLGLSICKQLAELMGGSVNAESVYGEGSTFTCTIPQQIIDPSPVGEISLDRAAKKVNVEDEGMFIAPEARILAVDDLELNLLVFTSFVEEHRMKVETAMSGRECIELASKNKYDMIFMDHMMPEMDGVETFAKMRETGVIDDDTPVIMLTANAILGEEEKYLAAGFSAYLTKPINITKLDNMLLHFLPKEKIQFVKELPHDSSDDINGSGSRSSALFDIKTGLKYNNNSLEIYHVVLKMYVTNGNEKLEQIRKLAEKESWKDYVTEVHALKSTSLMIGSEQLSEAARELEAAGKSGNYSLIKEKNDALLELYSNVISIGRELLTKEGILPEKHQPAENAAELEAVSEDRLRELFKGVKEACAEYDADAVTEIYEKAAAASFRGKALEPYFYDIKAASDDFEYDKAADISEKAFEKLIKAL